MGSSWYVLMNPEDERLQIYLTYRQDHEPAVKRSSKVIAAI